jgi:hypothetical protein
MRVTGVANGHTDPMTRPQAMNRSDLHRTGISNSAQHADWAQAMKATCAKLGEILLVEPAHDMLWLG